MARKLADRELAVAQYVVAERWRMATTRLQVFEGDDRPGHVNSKAIEAISDNIRDLAYRMAGEDPNSDEEDRIERKVMAVA